MRKQDPSVRSPGKYACTAKSPARFATIEVIQIFLPEESGIPPTFGFRNPQRESSVQDYLGLPCMAGHAYFSSNISSDWFCHTSETAVVILLPPDAPIISCTSPVSFVKMAGDMDENGRLPGAGKLTSDG